MQDNQKAIVGTVSFANGEKFSYTDPEKFIAVIKEELEYCNTTGFRYKIVDADAKTRKAIDDVLYDLFCEENPHDLAYYETCCAQKHTAQPKSAERKPSVLDDLKRAALPRQAEKKTQSHEQVR